MRRSGSVWCVCAAVLMACAPGEPTAEALDVPDEVEAEEAEGPMPRAPDAPDSKALMPALGSKAPPFPYLPGEDEAVELAREVASWRGISPLDVDPGGKALYHAAAVTSANLLVALLDAADEMALSLIHI